MSDDENLILKQDLEYQILLKNMNEAYIKVYDKLGGETEYIIDKLDSSVGVFNIKDDKGNWMYFEKPNRKK